MSIKLYRLLRNNKEEGPFTAEELIQKNLRPYDLIWVDGSSAAWRYPGEITQFKQYVPLPGESNVIQPVTNKFPKAAQPATHVAIAINNNTSPAIKEKPRYKVSAAWSKIQTVATPAIKDNQPENEQKRSVKRSMVTRQAHDITSKSLSWEDAWLDWEKEKDDISATAQKVLFNTKSAPGKQPDKKTPALETKYAQPLHALEDKYIDNILQQKQTAKRSFSFGKTGNFILPAFALIIIFSIAYWLFHDTDIPAIPSPASRQQAVSGANTTNAIQSVNTATDEKPGTSSTQQQAAFISKNTVQAERAKERKKVYVQPAVNHDSKIAAISPAPTQDTQSSNDDIDKTQAALDNKTADNLKTADNSKEGVNVKNAAVVKPSVNSKKKIAGYVNLPAQVEMKNGVASIKVENVGDVDLDLVVVDVQYFNAANNFKKGETFYLHNLKAGRDVTIKTPKDEASTYATSKISLISSDAKQLYVVNDN